MRHEGSMMNPIAQEALERSKTKVDSAEPVQLDQSKAQKGHRKARRVSASQQADKFVARLPDDLRTRLEARSKSDEMSMNSVLVCALKNYLGGRDEQSLILESLVLLKKQLQNSVSKDSKVS